MTSETATPNAKPRGTAGQTTFRFPCGHLEAEPVVKHRPRAGHTAVWAGCARCNLIVLLVDRAARRRAHAAPRR